MRKLAHQSVVVEEARSAGVELGVGERQLAERGWLEETVVVVEAHARWQLALGAAAAVALPVDLAGRPVAARPVARFHALQFAQRVPQLRAQPLLVLSALVAAEVVVGGLEVPLADPPLRDLATDEILATVQQLHRHAGHPAALSGPEASKAAASRPAFSTTAGCGAGTR